MNNNLCYPIREIIKGNYIVPLYQRSFTWGCDEIETLLRDVFHNFKLSQTSGNGIHYFIGSLIVIKRKEQEVLEVIDGQQRLTLLSLLVKYLSPGICKKTFLKYDSRSEINDFLVDLYSNVEKARNKYSSLEHSDNLNVRAFVNALNFIDNAVLEQDNENTSNKYTMLKLRKDPQSLRQFTNYLLDNVMMVKVIMPEDTDVASYFEIMNNRGEQLQKHEILKSLMMSKLSKCNMRGVFARIWDACSQMDFRIQKSFNPDERIALFGENYSDLNLNNILGIVPPHKYDMVGDEVCIDDLLEVDSELLNSKDEDNGDVEYNIKEKSIIDFPNFLMHVLRLYSEKENKDNNEEKVPLDEKSLLDSYNMVQPDAWTFIKYLLFYRVIFDRYIVKSVQEDSDEDNLKWSLKEPAKYGYKKNGHQYFKVIFNNLYSKDEDNDSIDFKHIVKAVSLLQVSRRQRINKTFLYNILSWFSPKNGIYMKSSEYRYKLNGLILHNSKEACSGIPYDNWYDTPHIVFLLIDYLYWSVWIQSKADNHKNIQYPEIKYIEEDFDFRYWNSIEHHYPQSFEKYNEVDWNTINNLGNLCLISKNANSSLNDKNPIEKVSSEYYRKNLPPKRKIMYDITKENSGWNTNLIETHYKNISELIKDRYHILGETELDINDSKVLRAMLAVSDISEPSQEWLYGSVYEKEKRCLTDQNNLNFKDAYKLVLKWVQENQGKDLEDFITQKLNTSLDFKNPENEWRKLFVQYPEILEYCQQRYFGFENSGKSIQLMDSCNSGPNRTKQFQLFLLETLYSGTLEFNISGNKSDGIWIKLNDIVTLFKNNIDSYLHIWIENFTGNWCYEIYSECGANANAIRKLKINGWIRKEKYKYYIEGREYLFEVKSYGITDSICRAIKQINCIISRLKKIKI